MAAADRSLNTEVPSLADLIAAGQTRRECNNVQKVDLVKAQLTCEAGVNLFVVAYSNAGFKLRILLRLIQIH